MGGRGLLGGTLMVGECLVGEWEKGRKQDCHHIITHKGPLMPHAWLHHMTLMTHAWLHHV